MSSNAPHDAAPADPDIIPLLPQGIPIFDSIPAKAVILEALAPALGNGIMVVRRQNAVGVILVVESMLHDIYCFSGGHRFVGEVALKRIKGLADATVTAHKLDPEVIEVIPSLLRGELCYDDLKMAWTNWPKLLSDILGRDGTYIIEIFAPRGRGVTCIVDGKQVATYSEAHPQLGDSTLVDSLFAGEGGTIRIRKATPFDDTPVVLPPDHTAPPDDVEDSEPEADEGDVEKEASPEAAPHGQSEDEAPDPFDSLFEIPDSDGTPDPDEAPDESPLITHLDEFKSIAREHLQRSAARVETILNDGASQNRPISDVFNDIRALTIRGVMRSTLEEVVEAMEKAAES